MEAGASSSAPINGGGVAGIIIGIIVAIAILAFVVLFVRYMRRAKPMVKTVVVAAKNKADPMWLQEENYVVRAIY